MFATLKGVFTALLLAVNVVVWFVPIFGVAILKLLLPFKPARSLLGRWLTWFGEAWVGCNRRILALTQRIDWDLRGVADLQPDEWYLVLANHRSWVDILVLQAAFHRRIPFLKFFIKQQLVWVPFLGIAWWAMDMPFMKRHTAAEIERNPELRNRDLETTQRACRKFRLIPTSVINFVEGTRFTPQKRIARDSPYLHLLPPRTGGVAFVLATMGDILHRVIDATIVYRPALPSFWDLCCGRVERITVHVRDLPMEPWLASGAYAEDPAFRERFRAWLEAIWSSKDQLIARLETESART
jgi:1-acyl-sn-glycerol-3-phosphate acyltransferase